MAALILGACKKAEELKYDSHDNIYLDFQGTQRDSILYTFAYEPARAADTQYIPVRISGIRQGVDRKFILRAITDSSTALPGTHYKALQDYYVMPKDQGFVNVPVILYNTDPALEEKSVTLKFKLYATDDFSVNLPTLISGKLVFSNKLERPDWWGMWFGDYYSRAKHQFFLITTGQTYLSTNGLDAPKNLYFVSLVTSFLNDPAAWISKNQDRGYVLEPRPDGDFDFYNTANPSKKILYHLDQQAGEFFFIDENGAEVN